MTLVGTALFAVVLAGSAVAQPTGVSPVQVAKPAAPKPIKPAKKSGLDDPDRIVCKREHVVGSNRPQKVCMTVADRERLKDQADQLTDPGRRTAGTPNDFSENPQP
ncbi:hypothetical protein GVN21_10410 [Caulobacter sp. SLTY]|uniref:hypothetical protein n=1 Tax=Caulobacter sp. SLTY TaxID=2683262 RepID=UPI001412D38A|nr:hypothetical protein [Caulobacter sp. SLTY]NBB15766.1 hypothetical protein [Caulobacter sp. SLTY]